MTTPPSLLDDDGTASMATALMTSHHAFRRDLTRFRRALERILAGDDARAGAVRAEWQWFRAALHGHHESEDGAVFPGVIRRSESVRATVEKLTADHRHIDPLLERGDRAFAEPLQAAEALAIVRELKDLLNPHLALEEAEVVPFLRGAGDFPVPPGDEVAEMYAQGFSWSLDGIAPEVVERVLEMFPESLRRKLPAARAAFAARCQRAWGPTPAGTSRTPVPDEA